MADYTTDTTVRISGETRAFLSIISDREGLSFKEIINNMSEFYAKNPISVKEKSLRLGEGTERIIKIIRSIEKDLLVPMGKDVFDLKRKFEDVVYLNDQAGVEGEEQEESDVVEKEILQKQERDQVADDVSRRDYEKSKKANESLVRILNDMIGETKLTKKSGAGAGTSYIIKISETELDTIKQTIKLCTIQ
jgi:hypothetical protein